MVSHRTTMKTDFQWDDCANLIFLSELFPELEEEFDVETLVVGCSPCSEKQLSTLLEMINMLENVSPESSIQRHMVWTCIFYYTLQVSKLYHISSTPLSDQHLCKVFYEKATAFLRKPKSYTKNSIVTNKLESYARSYAEMYENFLCTEMAQEKTLQFIHCIKQSLMESACHPTRLQQILPIDDLAALY